MTQTLTSEWGGEPLTVDAVIPTAALQHILGRVHVATPDEEVEADVRERLAGSATFPAEHVEETVAAALWIHGENRRLYVAVMSGRL